MLSLIRYSFHLPIIAYVLNNKYSHCDALVGSTVLAQSKNYWHSSGTERNSFNHVIYIQRYFYGIVNKIKTTGIPCQYCQGSGFLQCQSCISGCWRCDNSTLCLCLYCRGGSIPAVV